MRPMLWLALLTLGLLSCGQQGSTTYHSGDLGMVILPLKETTNYQRALIRIDGSGLVFMDTLQGDDRVFQIPMTVLGDTFLVDNSLYVNIVIDGDSSLLTFDIPNSTTDNDSVFLLYQKTSDARFEVVIGEPTLVQLWAMANVERMDSLRAAHGSTLVSVFDAKYKMKM